MTNPMSIISGQMVHTGENHYAREINLQGIGGPLVIPEPQSVEEAMLWGREIGKAVSHMEIDEARTALSSLEIDNNGEFIHPIVRKMPMLASIVIGFEFTNDSRGNARLIQGAVFNMSPWWSPEDFGNLVSGMRYLHRQHFWEEYVRRDLAKDGMLH